MAKCCACEGEQTCSSSCHTEKLTMKEAEELERQLLWAERLTKAEKSIVALVCGYYAGAMRSNGQPLGINKDVWVSLLGKVGVENPEQYL